MNLAWERLGEGGARCRLPFLDVTVGVVAGRTGTLLIDTGTTLTQARAIEYDIQAMMHRAVTHIVLTHNHFDHILGSSAFTGAAVYCAPEVVATMSAHTAELRAEAVRHGANADEIDQAIAGLRRPGHQTRDAVVDLGDRTVAITHPGRGHTTHDLIVVVPDEARTVVFCGDLVEVRAIRLSMSIPMRRPGPRRWSASWMWAGPMAYSYPATAPWSTPPLSADSSGGCSANYDEFQTLNVTHVIAMVTFFR